MEYSLYFEADALRAYTVHYMRGVFAAVWESFEWIKLGCFGTIFLDKIFALIWMFVMHPRII